MLQSIWYAVYEHKDPNMGYSAGPAILALYRDLKGSSKGDTDDKDVEVEVDCISGLFVTYELPSRCLVSPKTWIEEGLSASGPLKDWTLEGGLEGSEPGRHGLCIRAAVAYGMECNVLFGWSGDA